MKTFDEILREIHTVTSAKGIKYTVRLIHDTVSVGHQGRTPSKLNIELVKLAYQHACDTSTFFTPSTLKDFLGTSIPNYHRAVHHGSTLSALVNSMLTIYRNSQNINCSEKDLLDILLENYTKVGKETGYWAHYFHRDLLKKGALKTAKNLLIARNSSKIADGFLKLIDSGLTYLSVEAVALDPRFRHLFTAAELQEAQRRMNTLPAYVFPKKVEAEDNHPDEVPNDIVYKEGAVKQVTVNIYERDRKARAICLKKYGTSCVVCSMNFKKVYGKIGDGFIHVHHKLPLGIRRAEYVLKPAQDLVPVCPNCHAMLHTTTTPRTIEELKELLANNQQKTTAH